MKQKPQRKPQPETGAKPAGTKEIKSPVNRKMNREGFFERNTLVLAIGLISALVLFIFFDFILGEKYYVFKDIGSDSMNGYYPYLINSARYLRTEGFPQWSFAMGMGQSIFPGGFGDPFAFIANLPGAENVVYGIILSDVCKYIVTCLFFFLYLKEFQMSKTSSVIGALLFSLSGFMIVGGSWYTFSLEVVYMAFLLYSFEMLYRHNNLVLFPVAIALIGMYVPFNIFLYGLFLILYFLFRFFSDDDPGIKRLLILAGKLAGLTILGVLIGSVFFFPNLQRLIDSPRVSGNFSYFDTLMSKPIFSTGTADQNVTSIMRLFGNDMMGNGSNFKGWFNYLEAPLFYIGLLPLLLFTQVFFQIDRRRKLIYSLFLVIYLVPAIFPFFRNAFWAFTGDYYRGFSLFFSFVLLIFSLKALTNLDKNAKINLVVLGVTAAALLALLYFPYSGIDLKIRNDLQTATAAFLVFYGIVLALFNFIPNRLVLKIILVILVFSELLYFNSKTVRERDSISKTEWNQKTGYNDYTVDAVAWIKERDKGFFRMNKDYASGPTIHRSINDGMVQGYYGTQCYSSFNQKYYIRFLEETGVIEKGVEGRSRWAPGLSTRPTLQIMGSIKYNLSNKEPSFFERVGYDAINKIEDIKILKNRYFLPFGYTYDRYIPFGVFKTLSPVQGDLTLVKAVVAEEPVDPLLKKLGEFSLNDTAKLLTFEELAPEVMARKEDTLKITSFSENHISGTIEVKKPKVLFFSIPYDQGWRAMVDNKPQEPFLCNIGFTGLLIEPGKHTVQLNYSVHRITLYSFMTMAGILILIAMVALQRRKKLISI
jgi:uncharacterized membrane protein YfhO